MKDPENWKKIKEESKAGKDMVASRLMFDESERRHPVQEEERINVLLHKYAYRCVSAKWQTGVVSDDYLSGRNEITGLSA